MADLLTLAEYKTYANITNTRKDTQITAAIPGVTRAISLYTERDFTNTPPITEPRQFQYDDSGYLDIDDAVSVTSVTAIIPNATNYVFQADEWYAQPFRRDDNTVYWYLILPGWPGGPSPEMGFMRNLDVLYREGRWQALPIIMEVAASWGWPSIPEDVKMAAKWTLDDWLARRPETAAPAEAIESYSRSFGSQVTGEALAMSIPMRARDLLSPYTKVRV